jgi:hypothetical protein
VNMVDSWYQRYLGRSVDPGGLNNFAGMLRRGSPPDEVQSIILGSDEFWNNNGGTPSGFIAGLYGVILNRQASVQEIAIWLRRYVQVRQNRSQVARDFIAAAQQELLGQQQNNPMIPW